MGDRSPHGAGGDRGGVAPSALTRSAFSNIGDWVTVSTLGEDILSEYPDGDYPVAENLNRSFGVRGARWNGTSFATPLVAAEILRIAALDVRAGRVEPGGALAAAGRLPGRPRPGDGPGVRPGLGPPRAGSDVDPTAADDLGCRRHAPKATKAEATAEANGSPR